MRLPNRLPSTVELEFLRRFCQMFPDGNVPGTGGFAFAAVQASVGMFLVMPLGIPPSLARSQFEIMSGMRLARFAFFLRRLRRFEGRDLFDHGDDLFG